METIIDPVSRELIKAELTPERFVRETNFGSNQIYIVNHHNAPNIVREVGRLREFAFRSAGGGTGKACDLDEFDTADVPYEQLIVWDPESEEILGGYRFVICNIAARNPDGSPKLATTELFTFSDEFNKQYVPYVLELGRSFVQPKTGRKSIFALDNLWDGLGAIVVDHPSIKYLYGKVTMYQSYNALARDYILYFLKKYFGDSEGLLRPKRPLGFHTPVNELSDVFTGTSFREDYKILSKRVRDLNENIPPLINSYMQLSSKIKTFGTALNAGFGNVEETGILVPIADIYPEKTERHIASYLKGKLRNVRRSKA